MFAMPRQHPIIINDVYFVYVYQNNDTNFNDNVIIYYRSNSFGCIGYLCDNRTQCVNYINICDGNRQCKDGTDEGNCCKANT